MQLQGHISLETTAFEWLGIYDVRNHTSESNCTRILTPGKNLDVKIHRRRALTNTTGKNASFLRWWALEIGARWRMQEGEGLRSSWRQKLFQSDFRQALHFKGRRSSCRFLVKLLETTLNSKTACCTCKENQCRKLLGSRVQAHVKNWRHFDQVWPWSDAKFSVLFSRNMFHCFRRFENGICLENYCIGYFSGEANIRNKNCEVCAARLPYYIYVLHFGWRRKTFKSVQNRTQFFFVWILRHIWPRIVNSHPGPHLQLFSKSILKKVRKYQMIWICCPRIFDRSSQCRPFNPGPTHTQIRKW